MRVRRYAVVCGSCGAVAEKDDRGLANRAAADHYRQERHVATVEDRKGEEAGPFLSVCLDCPFTYAHGDTNADRSVGDAHRQTGGSPELVSIGEDVDPHRVAVIDAETGDVHLEATTDVLLKPWGAVPRVEDLRAERAD